MRPARALIDLQALRHNYQLAREVTGARALAVIKADAYGHGAVRCARALEAEADGFAVACIEEALELRAAGIRAPVLLLEGFFEADETAADRRKRLLVCGAFAVATRRDRAGRIRQTDSGVVKTRQRHAPRRSHPSDYKVAYQRLQASGKVAKIVLMSHFARADELDCIRSEEQLAVFQSARADLSAEVSLRNSPSILGWPTTPSDWVRPGLMLYGATPFEEAHPPRLTPAAGDDPGVQGHLRTRVAGRRTCGLRRQVHHNQTDAHRRGGHGLCRWLPASGTDRHPGPGGRRTHPVTGASVDGHAVH